MGGKSSRDSLGGSSVVMIVRGGGKTEKYSRPVSAQEVMIQHPQDVLTRLHPQDSDCLNSIVTPETVLSPGKKYYLVPCRTVEWLPNSFLPSAMAQGRGNNYTSDESQHSVPLNHSFCDVSRLSSMDPVTASPSRFADDQVCPEKESRGEGKSPKSPPKPSSRWSTPKSPSYWSPKSPSYWSPKSPSCFAKGRSSPKVCPGEDSGCDELLLDSLSSLSQAGPVKDEMDGRLPKEPYMFNLTESKCREVSLSPELPYDSGQLKLIEKMCRKSHLASELPHDSNGPRKATLHVDPSSRLPKLSAAPSDQTSDGLGEKHGQKVSCNTSSDRCVSTHFKLSPDEKAVGLNQSSSLVIPRDVKISLQREMEIPSLGQCISLEEPQKKSLLELLKRPDLIVLKPFVDEQQGIQIPTHGVDKEVKETIEAPDTIDIILREAHQCNDDGASVMFEEKMKGNEEEAKGGNEGEANSDTLSVEDKDDEDEAKGEAILNTQEEKGNEDEAKSDALLMEAQVDEGKAKGIEADAKGDAKGDREEAKGGDEAKKGALSIKAKQGGPLFVVESCLMPCIDQEDARMWQPKILSDALAQDEQRGGHREPYPESVSQDLLKESCDYPGELQTFNLMVPPLVGICNEPGAQCSFGEEESAVQDCETTCECKSIDLDGSHDNRSTKDLNARLQVQTLGDMLSRRSPNYLELIAAGSELNGMLTTLLAASSLPSVAPFSSSLASSSSSVLVPPPSSMAVSRLPPSKAFLSSPSSRAPSSPWSRAPSSPSSSASLSLLMEFDAPTTKTSDPSEFSSKQKGNLALLGFNSLMGTSLSIHEQAKAHTRAHRFMMGKPSQSASSSTTKQKQECRHPLDQGDMEGQEAWRLPTGQQCGSSQLLSLRRLRNLLLRPSKKRLSPISELSPEQSPASISALMKGPSP